MGRIALLTSGGGAPGRNAVLRAAVATAAAKGVEVIGIRDGFSGLLDGASLPLSPDAILASAPGSVLGDGRCPSMRDPAAAAQAAAKLKELDASSLLVIGGDGTTAAALALSKAGVPTIAIPSTVEDDVRGTAACVGVDSAVNALLYEVETLQSNATGSEGPLLVTVPGKFAGHLALLAAAAAGAAAAVLPERPFPWDRLAACLSTMDRPPLLFRAEGAGSGTELEQRIQRLLPGVAPRLLVAGETIRTAAPSFFDRMLGAMLGGAAVEAALGGATGKMIAFNAGRCFPVPLEEVAGRRRQIPPELFELAKAAGVVFE